MNTNTASRPWPRRLARFAGLVLAVSLLAFVVWFIGPLLTLGEWRPLETPSARVVAFALLLSAGWGIRWLTRRPAVQGAMARIDLGNAAIVLTALLVAASLFFIGRAYLAARGHIEQMRDVAESIHDGVKRIGPQSTTDEILRLLDKARSAAGDASDPLPPLFGMGLDKAPLLAAAAGQTYRRLLNDLLLPRMVQQLEQHLRNPKSSILADYEVLKTYLVIADRRHRDPRAVEVMAWLISEPHSDSPAWTTRRDANLAHLDAMLAEPPIPPVVLDEALVSAKRQQLARVPRQEIALRRFNARQQASDPLAWTVSGAAGPHAAAAFSRASGRPLTDGFDGLQGSLQARRFQASLRGIATQIADETWVLGATSEAAPPEPSRLMDEMLKTYQADYVAAWQSALADIRIARPSSTDKTPDAVVALQTSALHAMVMVSPSPLQELARSVAIQTSAQETGAGSSNRIDDAFADLHQWVNLNSTVSRAPIDESIESLRAAYDSLLAEARKPPRERTSVAALRPVRRALDSAAGAPAPFDAWIRDALRQAQGIVDTGAVPVR